MSLRYARLHHARGNCRFGIPEDAGPAHAADRGSATADAGPVPSGPRHRVAGLTVDTEQRTARAGGRALVLTYMEFELLARFVAHPRRVHSRRHLLTTLWGHQAVSGTRTVDVHVARLRRKLGPGYQALIRTVRQVGYALDPAAAPASRGEVCGPGGAA
ncbi:winged helix-turn-helix domain-containing protein [Streptomyces sp. NPDC057743]|uniref:winged helix-turn-helix domain-containing protein n=1 Tax=Streptomyces sp. NPDC057743 TaxID=3346236 RepID=UPI003681E715